jgi:hypothetical protein
MTVVGELARYKLDLVGVQEVRWDKAGTIRAGDYTLFYGKRNDNHQLGTGFFVHQRILPAVKKVVKFALRSINLLFLFGMKRNCLISGRSQLLYLFIRRVIKQTVVTIVAYHSYQLHTKFYQTSFCQG